MSLSDSQKIDTAYKHLLGVAETSTSKQFFEEAFATGQVVTPEQIWRDAAAIPAQAPNISPSLQDIGDGTMYVFGDEGIVRFFYQLVLQPVDGSPKAFYHPQLKDAIPFNYDSAGSYNYSLKNAANFNIAFGIQDWVVDPVAGVLMFFGSNLASIGISTTQLPKLSFFKYIGRKGFPTSTGGGGSFPVTDDNVLLESISNPLKTAQFTVGGTAGNTTYILPGVNGGLRTGTLLLRENLNATINEIGIIDGGETV
jgi:hypothetical protein